MSTSLRALTETQILEDIRRAFEGESLHDVDIDRLIATTQTLEDLIAKIAHAIQARNSKPSR